MERTEFSDDDIVPLCNGKHPAHFETALDTRMMDRPRDLSP
jgi:hypothetical protein